VELNKGSVSRYQQALELLIDSAHAQRLWIIAEGVIALLLCSYLMLGIVVSINRAVQSMQATAKSLSGGDFKARFEVLSRDSMADISTSLNQMIAAVGGLINDIQESSEEVSETSSQLQTSAELSRKEVDNQRNQTSLVATAATEMAATVREVAQNCVMATEATENANASALNGEKVVNSTISSINDLAEEVGKASQAIAELEQEVGSISNVVGVINSIAEQTNLLALNAAIEAARAGETGRGFAVVADEVRNLASRTQESTTEIQAMIEKLQSGSSNAVQATSAGQSRAELAVDDIGKAGEALQQIRGEISRMVDLNAQIATAAEEQSMVAEDISMNTNNLSDAAESIMEQVNDSASATSGLKDRAESLNQSARSFSV